MPRIGAEFAADHVTAEGLSALLHVVRSGSPAGSVSDALRSAISRIRAGGSRSVAAYDDRR